MAIVNIDLSEYDAIRNRNRELEEQVKELKKINEGLKNGTKVILRKEIEVEKTLMEREPSPWGGDEFRPKIKKKVETSESYVNFEDVRLKVENEMRKDIEASIEIHKRYDEKYKALDEEFQQKRVELEASCKKKLLEENDKMRDAYLDSFKAKEARISALTRKLKFINSYAKTAFCIAENSFFMSKKVERLLKSIRDISAEL